MGRRKRQRCFIPKSEGTTFRLLHRSQKDPSVIDESLGDRVLHPAVDAPPDGEVASSSEMQEGEGLEERHKYGIYFKDDYNYLQHLKDVGEAVDISKIERTVIKLPPSAIRLPTTVFETEGMGIELKVGLLNMAAEPASGQLDPDIAAALEGYVDEGDFEGDEELEDDFIVKATATGSRFDAREEHDECMAEVGGMSSDQGRDKRFSTIRNQQCKDDSDLSCDSEGEVDGRLEWEDEEVLGKRRRLLMCATRQSDAMKMVDEHFDAVYAKEYGSDDNYESDCDGHNEHEGVEQLVEPDSDQLRDMFGAKGSLLKRQKIHLDKPEEALKQRTLEAAALAESMEESGNGETVEKLMVEKPGGAEKWDCESILSTYSTLYNHPTLIRESGRGTRRRKGASNEEDEAMDCDYSTAGSEPANTNANTHRPKDESAEEKRARKHAVKEQRRLRREEKKANQIAFKEESMKIASQKANSSGKARPIK